MECSQVGYALPNPQTTKNAIEESIIDAAMAVWFMALGVTKGRRYEGKIWDVPTLYLIHVVPILISNFRVST